MRVDKALTDVNLQEVANPSFKDGSAAMLSSPDFLARALGGNKEEIRDVLTAFQNEFDTFVEAIRSSGKDGIAAYIEKAASIRKEPNMPKERDPDVIKTTSGYIRSFEP